MRSCTVFVTTLCMLITACGGSTSVERREYKLQGQVLSLSADRKEATIKHEDIPGFMAAMTMPYHVRDAKELESLAPGDLIDARLVVVTNDAYLEAVRKVGSAPLERADGSGAPGMNILPDGAPVPNVELIDQDGRSFTLDTFRGSAVIATFTYTSCPIATMCPLVDRHFAAMQTRLQQRGNELRVRLLTVTIDPVKDTPSVLKEYGKSLGADPRIWTLATGDPATIEQWMSRFGVSVSRNGSGAADITHNLRTAIIDRHGNLVRASSGSEWTPEQMLADVRVMVGVD